MDDSASPQPAFSDDDYRVIADFRARLREFLHFSDEAARDAGISPQQHQLLLAVRGFAGDGDPTIGELANALQIRHHSCVGLINRLEQNGYVRRASSTEDARKVHVLITTAGEQILARLTRAHQREHQQLHAVVEALVKLERSNSDPPLP